MKRALIVAGGSIEDAFCLEYLQNNRFDHKTAVDLGLQFFYQNNLLPDRIVGDFDSIDPSVLRFFEEKEGIAWVRLIPEKDDTDTEAAVQRILAEGYGEVHILGATGNRLDHMLGNVGLLGLGFETDTRIFLVDSHNRVRMIQNDLTISKNEQFGKYVSLLPVTPQVSGITLTGMKYPLSDYTMVSYKSLGVSNEIVEDAAEIYLKDGALLVVESKD